MNRQLEAGTLASLSGTVAALAFAAGAALTRIVSPGSELVFTAHVLSVLVIFLSTIALALALAATGRLVSTASGIDEGFWPGFAMFMQDLALWFLVRWLLLWTAPFLVGVTSVLYLIPRMGNIGGGITGTVAAVVLLILFRRFLPNQLWQISAHFDPTNYFGWQRSVMIFVAMTAVGHTYVHSLYKFDVTPSATMVSGPDSLEVRAHLSGRITNHDHLSAQFIQVAPRSTWRSAPAKFHTEEAGTYVTWFDTNSLAPGVYRLRVYLRSPAPRSPVQQIFAWLAHQRVERNILVRVRLRAG